MHGIFRLSRFESRFSKKYVTIYFLFSLRAKKERNGLSLYFNPVPQLTKSLYNKISKNENSQQIDQYFFLSLKKMQKIELSQIGDYIIIYLSSKNKECQKTGYIAVVCNFFITKDPLSLLQGLMFSNILSTNKPP